MFPCNRCNEELIDGAQCSACQVRYHFGCAGVTEAGYRKRKTPWKCPSCKTSRTESPSRSPGVVDTEVLLAELKQLSLKIAVLPGLDASIKAIKAELHSLKPDLSEIKQSIDFVDSKIGALSNKMKELEKEVQSLKTTRSEVETLTQRVLNLENQLEENDQRTRLNNIEIKGVPVANSENLFEVLNKIGSLIKHPIPKDQVNCIARIPTRNSKEHKSILVSVHSRYVKDDFVAAAKKSTLTSSDLGLKGGSRIFINDHLTKSNKLLLNKTKAMAKERGFSFTWVRGCKIFVRKNPMSPVITIKTESDLKKL